MSDNNITCDKNSVVINIADWSLNKVNTKKNIQNPTSVTKNEEYKVSSGLVGGNLIQFNKNNKSRDSSGVMSFGVVSKGFSSSIASLKKSSKKNDLK